MLQFDCTVDGLEQPPVRVTTRQPESPTYRTAPIPTVAKQANICCFRLKKVRQQGFSLHANLESHCPRCGQKEMLLLRWE